MKRSGVVLAFVLFLTPALLISYRVFSLGYPFLPLSLGRIWQVTMEARVVPKESEPKLQIGLPFTFDGRRVVQEPWKRFSAWTMI